MQLSKVTKVAIMRFSYGVCGTTMFDENRAWSFP